MLHDIMGRALPRLMVPARCHANRQRPVAEGIIRWTFINMAADTIRSETKVAWDSRRVTGWGLLVKGDRATERPRRLGSQHRTGCMNKQGPTGEGGVSIPSPAGSTPQATAPNRRGLIDMVDKAIVCTIIPRTAPRGCLTLGH